MPPFKKIPLLRLKYLHISSHSLFFFQSNHFSIWWWLILNQHVGRTKECHMHLKSVSNMCSWLKYWLALYLFRNVGYLCNVEFHAKFISSIANQRVTFEWDMRFHAMPKRCTLCIVGLWLVVFITTNKWVLHFQLNFLQFYSIHQMDW